MPNRVCNRIQIHSYVTDDIYERVRQMSEKNNRSLSATVEWLLDGGLLLAQLMEITGFFPVMRRVLKAEQWIKDSFEGWRHGVVSSSNRQLGMFKE